MSLVTLPPIKGASPNKNSNKNQKNKFESISTLKSKNEDEENPQVPLIGFNSPVEM